MGAIVPINFEKCLLASVDFDKKLVVTIVFESLSRCSSRLETERKVFSVLFNAHLIYILIHTSFSKVLNA